MSAPDLIIFNGVKRLKFQGSGRVTLSCDGNIRGAVLATQTGGTLTLECGERGESNDGSTRRSGTTKVTAAGGSAASYYGNSIVSNGSISSGRIVSGDFTMIDNKATWAGGYNAEKAPLGFKINVPATDIIEINGKRVRVEDIQTLAPVIVREKTYRIGSGDVTSIQCDGTTHLTIDRFPSLSVADLSIKVDGHAGVVFEDHFVVEKLLIATDGHAVVKSKRSLAARTVTLVAAGHSDIRNVACIGNSIANASGHSTIVFIVNDVDAMNNTQSGAGSSVYTLMGEDDLIELAERLSMLAPAKPVSSKHERDDVVDLDDEASSEHVKKQRKLAKRSNK